MARKRGSSFDNHPNQLTFVERLTSGKNGRRSKKAVAAESSSLPPPVPVTAPLREEPSTVRRAMSSGISLTSDIVKDGAREVAVGGVRDALKLAIGTAVTGGMGCFYFLFVAGPPHDEAKLPLPPSRLETGALPERSPAPPPPQVVVKPSQDLAQAEARSPLLTEQVRPEPPAPRAATLQVESSPAQPKRPQAAPARKRQKAKPETRIFILEDFVDWLKQTPGF